MKAKEEKMQRRVREDKILGHDLESSRSISSSAPLRHFCAFAVKNSSSSMTMAKSLQRHSATTPGIGFDFSKEQWLQDCQYAKLPDPFTAKPGFFLAQVVGESMSRRIPNGSWCLFREPSDGSRNGKVVIVQSRDIQDPDTGGQYTVKIYRSEKTETEDSWTHQRIRLEPDSMDFNFKPLTLDHDTLNDLRVVGEFVAIAR